jgi:hypothetical protein
MKSLSKREVKSLNAGIQEFDLESSIHDCTFLPDVLMLTHKNLIAHANDQRVTLIVESSPCMVRVRSSLLEDGVCGDHFSRDQVGSDAEMFKRALCLGPPELA